MGSPSSISNIWAIVKLVAMWLLLIVSLPYVGAQVPSQAPSVFSKAMQQDMRSLAILSGVCLSLWIISIFVSNCFPCVENRSRRPIVAVGMRRTGLDPAVIETLPTMVYSDVKRLRLGQGVLECAVCLSEFEDHETLRLMLNCDHGFHLDCIDIWLTQHRTCPVCRTTVLPRPYVSTDQPVLTAGAESNSPNIEVAVEENRNGTVQRGQQEEEPRHHGNMAPNHSSTYEPMPIRRGRIIRSHSAGDFLVLQDEDPERFTLRLPSEVRKQVMDQAASKASTSRGRGNKSANGIGNGSSTGTCSGRQPQVLDRAIKSDRWAFNRVSQYLSRASPPQSSPRLGIHQQLPV
ncbi:RING-H2 finger protein ATL38-like isoform X2 [Punica granatum]|nr:RING-H2 finger protein ATL38-like isoform X2 [Punica granatum]